VQGVVVASTGRAGGRIRSCRSGSSRRGVTDMTSVVSGAYYWFLAAIGISLSKFVMGERMMELEEFSSGEFRAAGEKYWVF